MTRYLRSFFLLLPLLICANAVKSASLCTSDEFIYFNSSFKSAPKDVDEKPINASFCADTARNATNLVFRMGELENIEVEYSVPRDGKFFTAEQVISPQISMKAIYFSKDNRTFVLAACHGDMCQSEFEFFQFVGSKKTNSLLSERGTGGFEPIEINENILTKEKPLLLKLK